MCNFQSERKQKKTKTFPDLETWTRMAFRFKISLKIKLPKARFALEMTKVTKSLKEQSQTNPGIQPECYSTG